MTLLTGTKLGPYEIVGAIGAGGMGKAYGTDSFASRASTTQCLGCGSCRPARISVAYGWDSSRAEATAWMLMRRRRG